MRNAKALTDWAHTARRERSHGFVIEIAERDAISFQHVKTSLKNALYRLNEHDPAASDCMNGPFDTVEWQFEFAGLRLFVNVFATPATRLTIVSTPRTPVAFSYSCSLSTRLTFAA